MLIELHIQGYDYCYAGVETQSSYLVSKYKCNDSGNQLPILEWTIDVEWMLKEHVNRLVNLNELGI